MEGRGRFYDSVGALARRRAEPPAPGGLPDGHGTADRPRRQQPPRREGEGAAGHPHPMDPAHVVRGRSRGYREEDGVAPDSTTETYVAARLEIDSWRWAGVPWYVRAGKSMHEAVTEATVELQPPPRQLFDDDDHGRAGPQRLPLPSGQERRCRPHGPGQGAGPGARDPGDRPPVDFAAALGERHEPYERLIYDAIEGNTVASPARTTSKRPGASSSRPSTTPARSTSTTAARGARPRRRTCSRAATGTGSGEAR